MSRVPSRRPLAVALSLSLILSCPGLAPWQAMAAAVQAKTAVRSAVPLALPQLPAVGLPAAAPPALAAPAAAPASTLEQRAAEAAVVSQGLARPDASPETVHALGRRLDGEKVADGNAQAVAIPGAFADPRPGLSPAAPRSYRLAGAAALGLAGLSRVSVGLEPASSWPLHSWTVMLPFAAAAAALGALLAADLWTAGALTRRLAWSLQRRRGVLKAGLLEDGGRLFESREIDSERLSEFAGQWARAGAKERAALTASAKEDAQLGRQKLLIAYLGEDEPAARETLLSELGRFCRARLSSAKPLVLELLAKRQALPWLGHVDAARRLARLGQAFLDPADAASRARLEELAAFPDAETAGAAAAALGREPARASWAPRARGWVRRAALTSALLITAGSLTLAGAAGYRSAQYLRRSGEAAEASTRVFYSEEAFIFGDRYSDERIPKLVLPALERWSDEAAAPGLERALTILAESPDPKADNILQAILRRSDFLPLTDAAESTLLRTLVRRESPLVWEFMDEFLRQSADSPRMAARVQKMAVFGLEADSQPVFENVFRLLKTPNDQLRASIAGAIYGSLTQPAKQNQFFPRLAAVQARHSADAALNLWVEYFALHHAAEQPGRAFNGDAARGLSDSVIDSLSQRDAARAAFFAPSKGRKAEIPDAATPALLELVQTALANPKTRGSQPLRSLGRYVTERVMQRLLTESSVQLGLEAKMVEKGLAQKVPVYNPYMLQSSGYRLAYPGRFKLSHVRGFRAMIEEEEAARAGTSSPAGDEVRQRAAASFEPLEKAAKAAGMPEGGSPQEAAAERLNKVLARLFVLPGPFLEGLREAGVAPDDGVTLSESSLAESYSLEDVRAMRRYIVSATGNDDSAYQKALSAEAVIAVDELLETHYGQARALKGEAALWASLDAADEGALYLARLALLADAAAGDAAKQRRVLDRLIARMTEKGHPGADPSEPRNVLDKLFQNAKTAGAAGGFYKTLAQALGDKPAWHPLKVAARDRAQRDFTAAAGALGVFDRIEITNRGGRFQIYAPVVKVRLDRIEKLLAAARQGPPPAEQDKLVARAAAQGILQALLESGPGLGVPSGSDPASLVAEDVNAVLDGLDKNFSGKGFRAELARAGVLDADAPAGPEGWRQAYSPRELAGLADALKDLRRAGLGWNPDAASSRRPLTPRERLLLDLSIRSLEDIIEMYPAPAAGPKKLMGAALLALAALPVSAWVVAALAVVGAAAVVIWAWRRHRTAAAALAIALLAAAIPGDAVRRPAANPAQSAQAFRAEQIGEHARVAAAFRAAGAPLSEEAETRLIAAYLGLPGNAFWDDLDGLLQAGASDPALNKRLEKAAAYCIASKSRPLNLRAYLFLKSPSEPLRRVVENALYEKMTGDPIAGLDESKPRSTDERLASLLFNFQFYDALEQYGASDRGVVLGLERLLLRRAAGGRAVGFDGGTTDLDKLLNTLPLGSEELPQAVALLRRALEDSAKTGPVKPGLMTLARHLNAALPARVIKEGRAQFPRLQERLLDEGLARFVPQTSGYRQRADLTYTTDPTALMLDWGWSAEFPEVYRLRDLKRLRLALTLQAAAAPDAALDHLGGHLRVLDEVEALSRAAGVSAGVSPASEVSNEVAALLRLGDVISRGDDLHQALKRAGLAPANPFDSFNERYFDSYSAAQLVAIRAVFAEVAARSSYRLLERDVRYDLSQHEFFAVADRRLAELEARTLGRDVPAADDKTLWEEASADPASPLFMARLSLLAKRSERDAAVQLRVIEAMGARLSSPAARRSLEWADEFAELLKARLEALRDRPGERAQAYRALGRVMASAPYNEPLAYAARALMRADAAMVVSEATWALEGEARKRLESLGVQAVEEHPMLQISRLERALAAARQAESQTPDPGDFLKKSLDAAKTLLPAMIETAPALGARAGDDYAEAVADEVNLALFEVGRRYVKGLQGYLAARGLAPDNDGYRADSYAQRYSLKDLRTLRAMIASWKAAGKDWAGEALAPYQQKDYESALRRLDSAIAGYPATPVTRPATGPSGR